MKPALILMSKAPVAGKTKTRLQEKFSAKQSARIHLACLRDLHNSLKGGYFTAYLFYQGDRKAFPSELTDQFVFYPQRGKDLGERLSNAFQYCFNKHEAVIAIGSDCPYVSLDTIATAVSALKVNDVVLGPSNDGGYYLLGISRFYQELFQGITWGSETVLRETIRIVTERGLRYKILPEQVDLDTFTDVLALFENTSAHCPNTRKLLDDLLV